MFLKQCRTDYLLYMIEKEQADEKLLKEINQSSHYKTSSKKQNHIYSALGNGIIGVSIFIDFLWAILYVAELSLITISALSVIGILSLALGAGITWTSYTKANKKQLDLNKKMELVLCKEAIYNELFKRQENKLEKKGNYIWKQIIIFARNNSRLEKLNTVMRKHSLGDNVLQKKQLLELANNKHLQADIFEALTDERYSIKLPKPINKTPLLNDVKPINNKSKIIKAAVSGIGLTSILFGSFYVSIIFLLTGTAAAAFLTNPIGIAVSIAALSIFGLLYAYKSYQQSKQLSLKSKLIETKNIDVENIKYKYEETKTSINSLQKLSEKISSFQSNNEEATTGTFFKLSPKNSIQPNLKSRKNLFSIGFRNAFNPS